MLQCVFLYLLFSALKEEGILRVPGNAGRVKVKNPPLLFLGYREGPNELHCLITISPPFQSFFLVTLLNVRRIGLLYKVKLCDLTPRTSCFEGSLSPF